MSYLVLARKWRPRKFSELVGQEHVVRALSNALDHDRLHHAYLFSGTRGVGKTTLARILAKSLNCEQGVSSTPCGECSSCREIDAGNFVDLLEIDAASRTKVDQTRELLDNVPYAPVKGRYKVYLIDEVHMFSGHSFNALLKTLEEPPPHVKFLLATTDPQKLPVTILSRCLQFNLKHLLPEQIAAQLQHILAAEGIQHDAGSMQLVANAADGSMRDALSLLDQAIAFADGALDEEQIRSMLGTVSRDRLLDILQALAVRDGARLLQIVDEMAAITVDFAAALNEIQSILHQLAALQLLVPEKGRHDDLHGLAGQMTAEDVQLYYQIALGGQRDLPYAPDQRTGFEMTLLRMLAFRPATETQTDKQAVKQSQAKQPAVAATQVGQQKASADKKPAAPAARDAKPAVDDWPLFIRSLKLGGIACQLAENTSLISWQDNKLVLALDPAYEQLSTGKARQRFEQALKKSLGEAIKIDMQLTAPGQDTVAQQKQQQQQQRQDAAHQSIKNNDYVQALEQTFDATVDEASIKPL
ncbi:MAG: DNA polymerase III subunit gamma/tau [gamma proteobacterium symbiont of Bathyaustriella thionipta]|nr:DNA polymerase III subunit gamma/tau [gamma proteobacterium symbiont of Bathyaustriella thionipta]